MSITFEKLQEASFKGFSFLVPDETRTGGKKVVSHEYPNTDYRFTEELGKVPPKFTITAIIKGDDSIEDRKRFEAILEESGSGDLIHPIYGKLNAVSTTFSVSGNQREIGQFIFSINFEVSRNEVTPQPVLTNVSSVSESAEDARDACDDALEEEYKEPTFFDKVKAAATKANEIYDAVNERITKVVGTIQDNVSKVTAFVANVKRKVFTIVSKAAQVKASLKSLYASALDVANTPDELFDAWKDLVNFGFIESLLDGNFEDARAELLETQPANTTTRFDISVNDSILDEHTRLQALINTFEASAYKDYQTEDELIEVREFLENAFTRLMDIADVPVGENAIGEIPTLVSKQEVREAMFKLRDRTRAVLDQKSQVTQKIVDITPNKVTSIPLITYQYYGSQNEEQTIADLNPNISHSGFIEKTIKSIGD